MLAPDPTFKGIFSDEALAAAMTDGIAPDYWDELGAARSLPEAQTIRRRLLDVQESRRQLENLGYTGVALTMGAAILDPTAVAAGFLTGGGSFIGQGATRGSRALRAGLVATAGNLPIDATLATLDPDMGAADVAFGAISSFALGGSLGALIPAGRVEKLVQDSELERRFGGPKDAMGAASAFELSPEGQALRRGRIQELLDAQNRGIKAFHGTPHEFDKFSTSAIGTGEGNQSYGHGLYFSSDPKIAEWYRDSLSGSNLRFKKDGETIDGWAKIAEAYYKPGRIVETDGGLDRVVAFHSNGTNGRSGWSVTVERVDASGKPIGLAPGFPPEKRTHFSFPDADKVAKVLTQEGWSREQVGRVYEVRLGANEDELLDLTKKIKDQPEAVKKALDLEGSGSWLDSDQLASTLHRQIAEGPLGDGGSPEEAWLRALEANPQDKFGAAGPVPPQFAKFLSEQGIRGVKYRGTTSGATNYVIFNDSDIRIVGRGPTLAELAADVQRRHAKALIDAQDFDPELRAEVEKLPPDEIIARYSSPIDEADAPERRLTPAGSTVRPATDAEVDARAAQILEDSPALTEQQARSTAEAQIKAEDAAAAGDGPKPPKGPPEPPEAPEIEPHPKRPDTYDPIVNDAPGLWTGVRISMIGRLSANASKGVRAAASILGDNRLMRSVNGKKTVASDGASAAVRRRKHAVMTPFAREYVPAERQFIAAFKKSGRQLEPGDDHVSHFNRTVADAVEDDGVFARVTGPVKRVAKAIRDGYADQLDWAKSHQLEWAQRVQPNQNYFTRVWKVPAFRALEAARGRSFVVDKLLAPAMDAVMEVAVDPAIVRKFASKWYDNLISGNRDDLNLARVLGGDPEAMRAFLDTIDGISAEAKDRIVVGLARKAQDGSPANFRRRTALDENYEYVDPDTDEVIRIKDFLERNAAAVYERYIVNTTGAVAESVLLRKMSQYAGRAEGDEFKTWDALKRWIAEDAKATTGADVGPLGLRGKIDADLARLETLRRHVRGMPLNIDLDSTGDVAAVLRNIRSAAVVQRSGGFGFAAVTELGALMGEFGLGNIIARMPEAAKVTKALISGKASNELLQQFEMAGVNTGDLMVRHVITHLDFDEGGATIGRFGQRVRRVTNTALSLSGMPYVDAYSRVLSVMLGMDKFAQQAHRFVKDGKALDANWFAELGMDPARAERLMKGLSSDGVLVTYEGAMGRRVKRVDMEKLAAVAGQDAVHDLVVGMDRLAVRTIQTNDISLAPRFMQGELAKIVFQFRTFATNAYENHTLRRLQGIAHGEFDAFAAVVMGSLMSGLVYGAQTYVQSLGMDQKAAEKFRAERLTPGEIARSGFARTGTASILPPVLDNIATLVSNGPIFSHARYTELNPSGWLQNPTSANIGAAAKSIQTGFEAVLDRDDRITRSEANAFFSLLPFRNLVGVRNVLDAISSRLPDRERQ